MDWMVSEDIKNSKNSGYECDNKIIERYLNWTPNIRILLLMPVVDCYSL